MRSLIEVSAFMKLVSLTFLSADQSDCSILSARSGTGSESGSGSGSGSMYGFGDGGQVP